MSAWGWFFMIVSVGGTTGFFIWCIFKVLRTPGESDKIHGVLDTERRIEEQDHGRN